MKQPRAPYAKAKNLYWVAFNDDNEVWDGTDFVTFDNGDSPTYANAMTDPLGIGDYVGALPVDPAVLIPDGKYRFLYYERVGVDPDLQADSLGWVDEEFYIKDGVGQELRDVAADQLSVILETD